MTRHPRRRRGPRRGFNLVELLMSLAISAALLAATMVALDASFMAYQTTTEVASTHTIARLAMHRMLTLIRTGRDFRPLPEDPRDSIVQSNFIDFRTPPTVDAPEGTIVSLEWDAAEEALFVRVGGEDEEAYRILEGVTTSEDEDGEEIPPFTLEYELGFHLHRATIDLTVRPDDNMSVELDGQNLEVIRLVSTAMPREAAYD